MSRMSPVRRCGGRGDMMRMAAIHRRPIRMMIRRVRCRRHLLPLTLPLPLIRMMIAPSPSPPGRVGDVPSVVMIMSRRRGGGRGIVLLLLLLLLLLRVTMRRTTNSHDGRVCMDSSLTLLSLSMDVRRTRRSRCRRDSYSGRGCDLAGWRRAFLGSPASDAFVCRRCRDAFLLVPTFPSTIVIAVFYLLLLIGGIVLLVRRFLLLPNNDVSLAVVLLLGRLPGGVVDNHVVRWGVVRDPVVVDVGGRWRSGRR